MVALESDESENNEFDSVVERQTEQKCDDDLEGKRIAGVAYKGISTGQSRCSDTARNLPPVIPAPADSSVPSAGVDSAAKTDDVTLEARLAESDAIPSLPSQTGQNAAPPCNNEPGTKRQNCDAISSKRRRVP